MGREAALLERIRDEVARGGGAPRPGGGLAWLPVRRSWDPGRNETFLLFPRGARRPAAVLKAATSPEGRAGLRREREHLVWLASSPEEPFRESVPEILDFTDSDARTLLLMRALGGRPLPALLRRRTRHREALIGRLLEGLTGWLLAFHRTTVVRPAGREEFQERWLPLLDLYRLRFRLSRKVAAWLDHVESVLGDPAIESIPLVETHGDLCPANVLLEGKRVHVLDWELEWAQEFPQADLLHFLHCACMEVARDPRDYLELVESFLFGRGPGEAGRAFARCLGRYGEALPVARPLLEILPTLFWIEGAVLRIEGGGGGGAHCTYVVVEDRRCRNLERLCWRSLVR